MVFVTSGVKVAVSAKVEVGDGGTVAVLVAGEVGDGGTVAVLVAVEVGDGGTVAVLAAVEVGDGGTVAVLVAVENFGGVLVGTQSPCIKLPEIVSGFILVTLLSCRREALTALNDLQVNGINKPIKSASNASKISVLRFLFLFFSIPTS